MLKYILLCILAMSGYYAWSVYPIKHGPGVTNPDRPIMQHTAWAKPFTFKGNTLNPIKKYKSDVRVLQKKRYLFDDRSELSPIDILVGWNEMSDERNIEFIHFSMSDRTSSMSYTKPPIPVEDMHKQMEILHLIPSTKEIKDRISKLRAGHKINIEGIIVNVAAIDNYNWESSLVTLPTNSHHDIILWVESISVD